MSLSQIQITLPNEPKENIESVIFLLKNELNIESMLLLSGENNSFIIIRRFKTDVPIVMSTLSKIGVGIDFGIIDILPLNTSVPELASVKDNKEESSEKGLESRVSLEEIRGNIEEVSKIDFNYFIFIILASLVAGSGLLSNSPTILIASMILSPLMGPILAVSYGITVKNGKIVKMGLQGQIFGILTGFIIGIIMGLLTRLSSSNFELTQEMLSRSFPNVLDIVIAICGGIAVGFCITGGIRSALVGIAIAVALLPPVVNSGIVLLLNNFVLSAGSFVLMLTNIVIINLCAVFVFKIKKIESIADTPMDWIGPEEPIRKKTKAKKSRSIRIKRFSRRKSKNN